MRIAKTNKARELVIVLVFFVAGFGLIWGVMNQQNERHNLERNSTSQIATNTGCNSLLSSSCKDTTNSQGIPIKNWTQNQPANGSISINTNTPTQLSSCVFDNTNPPRSSLPPGEISPAELELQKKARTFPNADAFNNYIQNLDPSDKYQAICILDGWTPTQFYNDAISRS